MAQVHGEILRISFVEAATRVGARIDAALSTPEPSFEAARAILTGSSANIALVIRANEHLDTRIHHLNNLGRAMHQVYKATILLAGGQKRMAYYRLALAWAELREGT